MQICIDVINVRIKLLKNVKKRVFIHKIKTFVNVIKNVTLFLLAFDVGPIDQITAKIVIFYYIIAILWCCVIEYCVTLKVSKSRYKICYNLIFITFIFHFLYVNVFN